MDAPTLRQRLREATAELNGLEERRTALAGIIKGYEALIRLAGPPEIEPVTAGRMAKDRKNPRAGFERNARLVRHASMVIAFYAPGPKSPGTTDTVERAKAAGLPIHVFHEGRWDTA